MLTIKQHGHNLLHHSYQVKPMCYLLQHTQCGITLYPLFVPLNPNLYLVDPIETKGLDPLIFRNYIGYVPWYVYPIIEQPIISPTFNNILLEIKQRFNQ
jgi:hypothetical protein